MAGSQYSSHLSRQAASVLISLPNRDQRKVLDIADRIAASPFHIGDYQMSDSEGHIIENLLVDEFHFIHWQMPERRAEEFP